MTVRTYHRGAVVTLTPRRDKFDGFLVAPPIMKDRFNKQWNSFECVSPARLIKAGRSSYRNRQMKRGPIVRFGRKP